MKFLWFGPAIVARCGCMNNSGIMNEAAVQTVSAVKKKKQTKPATCYPQRCFTTVINAECHVFTYFARYCVIESIKDADSSLDREVYSWISSWSVGNRVYC